MAAGRRRRRGGRFGGEALCRRVGWEIRAGRLLRTAWPGVQRCFYITSLPQTTAAELAAYIRGHWAVENNLHWHLDVAFNEDQGRMRLDHAAENRSRLNRLALNLLKREKTIKASIRNKQRLAGWDLDYLLRLIST